MINVIPFAPEHLRMIDVQDAQKPDVDCHGMDDDHAVAILNTGPAVTAMIGDEVVFILGKYEVWKGRHIVWSIMSKSAGRHMIAVVRAIKRMIDLQAGDGRLEIIVRAKFAEGCKLARMMGFMYHHYEEKFLPDGDDAVIYVRYV